MPPARALTEQERHVIVHFEKQGVKARLPAGVNTEMIKNAFNLVLATGGVQGLVLAYNTALLVITCCLWYNTPLY